MCIFWTGAMTSYSEDAVTPQSDIRLSRENRLHHHLVQLKVIEKGKKACSC